jgi:hypothetical protein
MLQNIFQSSAEVDKFFARIIYGVKAGLVDQRLHRKSATKQEG